MILHGIAAVLWVLALVFAAAAGVAAAKDDRPPANTALAVTVVLTVAAFTLQVLA